MTLFVNFTDPYLVSRGIEPDILEMQISKRSYFKSNNTGKLLDPSSTILRNPLPMQLPPGVFADVILDQASRSFTSITYMFIFALVAQLYLKGNLDSLWSLYFTLQYICYLKWFSVPFPANVQIFNDELIHLVEFSFLSPEGFIGLFKPGFTFKEYFSQNTSGDFDDPD